MPEKTPKPPIVGGHTAVDSFVNQIRTLPQPGTSSQGGRLLFAIDATASREASWDLATSVQSEMFLSATDFHFTPPTISVDAGTVTFKLTNNGGTSHALEVEGNGVEEETDTIGPGESTELTVDLEEGEYEIYCPVGNHKDMGMVGTLTVGAASANSGGGSPPGMGSGY